MVATKLIALAAAAFMASTVSADADPIVIKGNKFFFKTNGTQFFIRGVDYQQNPNASSSTTATINDPLADGAGCQRDLPYLQKLRTNTVRVYAIDPTRSHDTCMNLFNANGIYVVADLSSPMESINQDSPSWNIDLYNRYTSVIDLMSKYSNTIGFFAGNEVANQVSNTNALPYVKASIRDMKAYIKSKNYRPMGVGYAATDDATIRDGVRAYMDCGSADTSVDFFGYNIYEWCSSADSYSSSGYQARTAEFQNYTVPAFFAEYGCNTAKTRTFPDTPFLFSDPMDQVWSGGLVYEYFQDANNYGLVTVANGAVQTLAAFGAYSSQIAKVNPTGVQAGSFTPTNTVLQSCPPTGASWNASANIPPQPNNDLCNCQVSNSSCVAASSITGNGIGAMIDIVCGLVNGSACTGIAHNGAQGVYGAYSMCTAQQQLNIVLNAYYVQQGSISTACSFGGNTTLQNPSLASNCAASISSAGGPFGTSTITPSGSSTGNAASTVRMPPMDFGILAVGVYAILAFASGAGLFLL